jgi:hypothetical protein
MRQPGHTVGWRGEVRVDAHQKSPELNVNAWAKMVSCEAALRDWARLLYRMRGAGCRTDAAGNAGRRDGASQGRSPLAQRPARQANLAQEHC